LEFEKPIRELEEEIERLRELAASQETYRAELAKLKTRLQKLQQEIFSNLSPWEKTQLARHPDRPYTKDYIQHMLDDFVELRGDRRFADDQAIIGGLASMGDVRFVLVGHQKGRSTKEKLAHNFGMPHPEGYRKALRLMKLAEKFHRPVLTLIDTPGAYPGIGAEERGQAEAIARNLQEMIRLRVPIVAVVTGEGGSGGALALGVGDRVLMLEHAIYSVISPESCAAILWRDSSKAKEAAEPLRLTAQDAKELGVIDGIVPEPVGGAHRNYAEMAAILREVVLKNFAELADFSVEELLQLRYNKFRKMGHFEGN